MRYRISDDKLQLFPAPGSVTTLSMEYQSQGWVQTSGQPNPVAMIVANGDFLLYNPWLLIKFVKMKFYELKGFDTTATQADFMRVFESLTGKDTGAKILSLSPQITSQYIGPWSVPDGSWNVYG